MATDIVAYSQSQAGFYVDRQWDPDRQRWAHIKAPIRLARYHQRILSHCFALDGDGRLPYDTVALCEPAKSGKSALASLVHQWFSLHIEPGSEQFIVSNKRDQARDRVFRGLCQSLAWNPYLHITPRRYELTTRAGTVVKAIPCNARTEAGARFTLASFDEPWAIVYEDGERLVSEFKSDPTRNACVRLFTGYGGYLESRLWHDLLTQGLAGEPVQDLADIDDGTGQPACWRNGRLFVFWSHACWQPWQTDEWLEGQRRSLRDPEYRRMIQTCFVTSEDRWIPLDAWHSLIDPSHRPLPPGTGHALYVGLDLATKPGGDDAACVAVYLEGDVVKLAWHAIWHGGQERSEELRLTETVEPFLLRMARQYRIAGLYFDPFQALTLVERLRKAGLHCIEVPQTHASRGPRDTALYDLIVNRQLVLYDDPEIRDAASHAVAQELGNGQIFLHKAGRGQIDWLVALSNCASEAKASGSLKVEVANLAVAIAQMERADRNNRHNGRYDGRRTPGDNDLVLLRYVGPDRVTVPLTLPDGMFVFVGMGWRRAVAPAVAQETVRQMPGLFAIGE